MFKKFIFLIFVLLITTSLFSQTTSHWGKVFRDGTATPQTGLNIDLYETGTSTHAYDLTESVITPGYYYHTAVATGAYDIWVGGVVSSQYTNIWIGASKLTLIEDQFNASAELGNAGIQDDAVDSTKIANSSIHNDDLEYDYVGINGSGVPATVISLGLSATSFNVNVDGSEIVITNDTLNIGALDSTDLTDGAVSLSDLFQSESFSVPGVLRSHSSGRDWGLIDSTYILNHSIEANDLWASTMGIDGDGLTLLTSASFGQTNTGLNVNVDGSTISITNDTLSLGSGATTFTSNFLGSSNSYKYGDSLLFAYWDITGQDTMYFDIPLPASGLGSSTVTISSITVYINGATSGTIGRAFLYSNALGVRTQRYSEIVELTLLGTNQTFTITPSTAMQADEPMLLGISVDADWLKVYSYKITYSF